MSENTAGSENACTGSSTTLNTKEKKARTGPNLYKGLLTSPKGLAWVQEFENKRKKFPVTPSTVTVQAQQGPVVVVDSTVECEREVADPSDYYTVLKSDASAIFQAEGDIFYCS